MWVWEDAELYIQNHYTWGLRNHLIFLEMKYSPRELSRVALAGDTEQVLKPDKIRIKLRNVFLIVNVKK